MTYQSHPPRYVQNGYVQDVSQFNSTVFSVAILCVSVLVFFRWSGLQLSGAANQLLIQAWNLTIQVIPARFLFALHQRIVGGSTNGASTKSLHERKRLAINTIVHEIAKSDTLNSILRLPLNPLNAASLSLAGRGSSERPPGLANPSNSCFQNSVLQGLASLDSFQNFVHNTSTEFGFAKDSINGAFDWLMRNLNQPESQGQTLWTPLKLMPMNIIQQQDAQEYFSRIMDGMEKEITRKLKPTQAPCSVTGLGALLEVQQQVGQEVSQQISQQVDQNSAHPDTDGGSGISQLPSPGVTDAAASKDQNTSSEQISDQEHGSSQEQSSSQPSECAPSSSVQNPVDGLLAQRLICSQCHHSEGISLVPFNTLTVPLSKSTWKSYELFDECLYDYLKAEELDGVECGKCTLLARQEVLESLLKKGDSDMFRKQLDRVNAALAADDYSEKALVKELGLDKKLWRRSTKTKHLAIARSPKALVLHVQRSSFNPFTFRQEKNNSPVKFPTYQDLSCFSLDSRDAVSSNLDIKGEPKMGDQAPAPSIGGLTTNADTRPSNLFALRAVIGHSGVHDYGHYVCYRKFRPSYDKASKDSADPDTSKPQLVILQCSSCHQMFEESSDSLPDQMRSDIESERWWRLSDESVWEVSEENVTQQTNAYMLFYERCSVLQSTDGHRCPDCIDSNQLAAHSVIGDADQAELTEEIAAQSQEDKLAEGSAAGSFDDSSAPSEPFDPSNVTPDVSVAHSVEGSLGDSSLASDLSTDLSMSSSLSESFSSSRPETTNSVTDSSIHSVHDASRQLMTPPCTPEPWCVADSSESKKTLVEAR